MENSKNFWGPSPEETDKDNNKIAWNDKTPPTQESKPKEQLFTGWNKPTPTPEKETKAEYIPNPLFGDEVNSPDFPKFDDSFKNDKNEAKTDITEIQTLDNKDYNFLGNIRNMDIFSSLYKINHDPQSILSEIDLNNLTPLDNDGRFKLSTTPESNLGRTLSSIKLLCKERGLVMNNFFLYKISSKESCLNIFKGNPTNHFIYFLQANHDSGDLVIDLSSINGPSTKILDPTPGMLTILPGWTPYRISKNMSTQDFIAIGGTLQETR